MQLTKLDRWLKERFIYETHILTLRLPEGGLPAGVKLKEIDSVKSGDYRFKLIIKDNDLADEVLTILKKNRLMYSTHIIEGKHWYNQRIAPEGRSFTYQWIFRFITVVIACVAIWGVSILLRNPALIATIKDTLNELRSGL